MRTIIITFCIVGKRIVRFFVTSGPRWSRPNLLTRSRGEGEEVTTQVVPEETAGDVGEGNGSRGKRWPSGQAEAERSIVWRRAGIETCSTGTSSASSIDASRRMWTPSSVEQSLGGGGCVSAGASKPFVSSTR